MANLLISGIIKRLKAEELPLDWYSGKRILVTGGAGFIGSWLVESLVRLGADVFVVDNLWRGSLENLRKSESDYWIPIADRFILGDLTENHVALSSLLVSKPDLVFHLADIVAGIDFVFSNERFIYRTNMLINTNVYHAVQQAGVGNLVYLGTACSYPQKLQEKPGREPLVESQVYPADPESAYGWSKLLGEYEAELLARTTDVNLGILRLHNVYGPRALLSKKRSQVIPSLIRKAVRHPDEEFIVWGSGNQARDFVYVGDVVDALLRVPLRGMGVGVIQIGTAKETTVAELASLVVKASKKNIPIRFDETKPEGDGGRSGDYSRAKTILGWDVFTSLADGLEQTYAWAHDQIVNRKIDLDG
ncbi:MAG: NAD-dependent epimerase/dehydratase family protein [Chloroflexi bacterium]|nr:NAD-dependent epimerase/dehydratase family protein [Chloroflexota bacterium]